MTPFGFLHRIGLFCACYRLPQKFKQIPLSSTLRYKKAQNEATTLQLVQKELAKLDVLLANDVEILRGKIEEAK